MLLKPSYLRFRQSHIFLFISFIFCLHYLDIKGIEAKWYFEEMIKPQSFNSPQETCLKIDNNERLDCNPEPGATLELCKSRGCCWKAPNKGLAGVPLCYFPSLYPSFEATRVIDTTRGYRVWLEKPNLLYMPEKEFRQAQVDIIYETASRLRIRVTTPEASPHRWEPPIPLGKPDLDRPSQLDYKVLIEKKPFGFKVLRNSTVPETLIDTTGYMAGSFILADQFLQMSMHVPSMSTAYGPGEHRNNAPVDMERHQRFALWARDLAPEDDANLYGVHNFMLGLSHLGRAFGIFLLNSNAQEVAVQALPSLTYRTIGGILDFFIFTGPTPSDVISQYQELIGKPLLPPYWSLGFHICRYGYKDLNDVQETLMRNLKRSVPLDSQWVDIDYMNSSKDFTISDDFKGLGDFSKNIRKLYDIRTVMMLDPGITIEGGKDYEPYYNGLEKEIFIRDSRTGKPLVGIVWPGKTLFPDFTHPNAYEWWFDEISKFHEQVPFDGLWIDMNEPSSFVDGSITGCSQNNTYDNPPYTPPIIDGSLAAKTVCPSALHYGDIPHYNIHNIYGYFEANLTNLVLRKLKPNKRPFLLTRSSFAGSGRYTSHWTGDNLSDWPDLAASIGQIINSNMFGIPMTGADICGFRGRATEELCIRWSQLGAFYPFSRNHNEIGQAPQDPSAWSYTATNYISAALQLRYYILPYFYSLFYRAHLNGTTVFRALAFEFPEDARTHRIVDQFLLGSCLLITPVLEAGPDKVTGYLPQGEWVSLITGEREVGKNGVWKVFQAPLSFIPVHMKAGCIIPMHGKAYSTQEARKTGLGIMTVVNTEEGSASGELFWDDGETENQAYTYVKFQLTSQTLLALPTEVKTSMSQAPAYTEDLFLSFVIIYGIGVTPSSVIINGKPESVYYDTRRDCLSFSADERTISLAKPFNLTWTY